MCSPCALGTLFLELLLVVAIAPTHLWAKGMQKYIVYVGTYTARGSKGIYGYSFEPATGRLNPLGLEATASNPSFLKVAPNRQSLYAVSETSDYKGQASGAVLAYRADGKTGQLTLLNRVSSVGAGPCYLSLDKTGRFVLVANYEGGSVAVFPVLAGGKLSEASGSIKHQDAGTNPERQRGPHAHAIETTPSNQSAIAADLGLDELFLYHFDSAKGLLTPAPASYAKLPSGAGPRHFSFHPSGRFLYLLNETNSTVTSFTYEETKMVLQEKQTISALPKNFSGQSDAAELQIAPTGRYLYVSNRGHDSIAVFGIDPNSGLLTLVENVPSGGKTPRHFAIDPSGSYLLVANQNSDNIVIFHIDPRSGRLTRTGEVDQIVSPACLAFMALE